MQCHRRRTIMTTITTNNDFKLNKKQAKPCPATRATHTLSPYSLPPLDLAQTTFIRSLSPPTLSSHLSLLWHCRRYPLLRNILSHTAPPSPPSAANSSSSTSPSFHTIYPTPSTILHHPIDYNNNNKRQQQQRGGIVVVVY